MSVVGARDLLSMRLRSQGLIAPPEPSGREIRTSAVADAARRLLALQGQDPVAALWALGLRAGVTKESVQAAFAEGLIVRSWPMRGTVHVVPAEDIGWLQRLTNPRALRGADRRRDFLGLSIEMLERMRGIAVAELRGGNALTRAELIAAFERAGIEMRSGWSYHSIWYLSQTGTIVFGPPTDARESKLVLVDEWIGPPRDLEGEEALAELVSRYIVGHGPATVADLGWWTMLTLTELKRAFAAAEAAGSVVRIESESGPMWVSPEVESAPLDEPPPVLLLPAFDELLLGYKDRTLSVDPANASRWTTSNGLFAATIVCGGRIAGTWTMRKGRVEAKLWDDAPPIDADELDRQIARVEDFGLPAE
ncbi:winged helix DNA-binding domain-containing protein [Amnibacterium flavum]|uniref:Winged helix DNA-binding domain-containing protein n=1 Tax=Amnibacterium flavum TaxID=2173173 RepID=A0A2V1HNK1_9MICO|nr:winged helix DNA-binding domain-containing protein [Amnibacterium flavum]PVZ94128.1 winged helix DNA-binding domain-containing protein [Amnibacterium flavum]